MHALVIDDARVMRLLLRQILQKSGFTVIEAANGHEGLEQLQLTSKVDVALIDCNMPGMNGLELLLALRADSRYRSLPVLMVTGEEDAALTERALAAGANDCVVKPFSREIICAKLHKMGVAPN
ncbi:MAG TPA: response regulator [Gemmataceae bacterium]|nr:response regulator [Gemmataceae bacterium]